MSQKILKLNLEDELNIWLFNIILYFVWGCNEMQKLLLLALWSSINTEPDQGV